MKSNLIRSLAVGSALALSSISLAGCSMNLESLGANNLPGMLNHEGMNHGSNDSSFSGADIMFAQMMIPHHQQAVDMGTLAETRAESSDVKALAAKIKSEQAPEVAQMKEWLKAANAPLEMDHSMGMGGMLSDLQMTALKNTSGTAFDKLFLAGMIAHHEGAILMAKMVTDSANPEAKALGKAIVDSQTEEVAYMKSLLAK